MTKITLTINGTPHSVDRARANDKLLDFLHDDLNATGTKLCCGIAVCRACTVQMRRPKSDVSEPIVACSTPIGILEGADITTVEGVAKDGQLDPVQEAFLDHFSFQCGYCAPGFVMATRILVEQVAHSKPDETALEAMIEEAIGPHICRCTGYIKYFEAARAVALDVLSGKVQLP